MICFDCKVKGKNRCVECEKKAVNDYRLAFQQLLLTTGGNLGTAGRQMMNQKARELEVEDVKAAIEKELMEEYKPTVKAEQPAVAASVPQAAQQAPATKAAEQSKGGVVDNREPLRPKSSKRGGGAKWFILLLLLAGVGGYFALSGDDKSEVVEPVATEQPVAAPKATPAPQQQPAKAAQEPEATPAPVATPAPAAKPVQPVQKAQPATPKTDADYEAGMAAYKDGDGLEAIKRFNASGSAQANYMLGVIYEKGCGNVTANAMMARKYYKKAAQQGHEEAKAKL
jgi:outer membrane biosynthesis protein TonB